MSVDPTLTSRFLSHTDDTGRFIVKSIRTGRSYYVEPMGDPHRAWGSASTSAGDTTFAHKKGDGKFRGSIDEEDSLITEANGFEKITVLEPGTSPFAYIDHVDAKYPDVVKRENDAEIVAASKL